MPAKPGADEDERQRPPPDVLVAGVRGGDVELVQDVVAQEDRLFDGLETDAAVGQAGDGQRPRDGAEGDDEHVVVDVALRDPRGARPGRAGW
ncbi:hypothetical protein [Actinomadura madurae]|uniref:hypothetical protein n=1 Tax=Actinomadura madurae TaxID=1993 RepID=UPI0027E2B48F|nr:hypothetical protein [Actinomadura madurae]